MKNKTDIVNNWLPRYTSTPLDGFGRHILLTNFGHYVELFAQWHGVEVRGRDRPMPNATADGITLINFGMRARAQAAYEALPAAQRTLIDTYRDGVNAGLVALSTRPFTYLLTRTAPAVWRSEDSLLVIAAMAFTLNDAENKRELAFAQMHGGFRVAGRQ